MSGTSDHLWGVTLAGGDGRRLQRFIRLYYRVRFGLRPREWAARHDIISLRNPDDRQSLAGCSASVPERGMAPPEVKMTPETTDAPQIEQFLRRRGEERQNLGRGL
ncbi:Nucleotidyl transferase [Candidatus Methylomirabilis lanthanidiphila]|uniref:Nucleotidyl transferase n=1 Tax=Candidatus Methylomirabilis lanthanidiphila TaxID=2211376 RepID=A0A564ZIU7_9BACT|nr:Nucleotidyl transferase [Candidatus Methylomirabilis lanthanidiphila]